MLEVLDALEVLDRLEVLEGLGLLACLAALEMLEVLARLEVLDPLGLLGLSRPFRGTGRLGAWGFRGALFPLHGRDALSVTPAVQDA